MIQRPERGTVKGTAVLIAAHSSCFFFRRDVCCAIDPAIVSGRRSVISVERVSAKSAP